LIERHQVTGAGGRPTRSCRRCSPRRTSRRRNAIRRQLGIGRRRRVARLCARRSKLGAPVYRSYGMQCPAFTCGRLDVEEKRHGRTAGLRPVIAARRRGGTSRRRRRRGNRSSVPALRRLPRPRPQRRVHVRRLLRSASRHHGRREGTSDPGRRDIIIRGENLSAKGIGRSAARRWPTSRSSACRSGQWRRVCACVVLRPGAESPRSPGAIHGRARRAPEVPGLARADGRAAAERAGKCGRTCCARLR
jgi:hypothetical protein